MNIEQVIEDIVATEDLIECAPKLSVVGTTLFTEVGVKLVVVGGLTAEFYTDGGYRSGTIDFCRWEAQYVPLRWTQDVMAKRFASPSLMLLPAEIQAHPTSIFATLLEGSEFRTSPFRHVSPEDLLPTRNDAH